MLDLMDLNHLLQHAHMTAETPLEKALLARLENFEQYRGVIDLVEEKFGDTDPAYLQSIIEAMNDFACDDYIDLRAKLELADKFYDVAREIKQLAEFIAAAE